MGHWSLGGEPFTLLGKLYPDAELLGVFSEVQTIQSWLRVEAALASAQAAVGVISERAAAEVATAARLDNIDVERLWREAAVVGYPILPLVRMISAAAGPEGSGRVHYGATTQDIMDTALAMQLVTAGACLQQRLVKLGDALANLVEMHRHTVMPGRTHGQQAVPTTFGAKIAVFLDEVGRHLGRLSAATDGVAVVSLYGAGGTSAGFGPRVDEVRAALAIELGLSVAAVPWHVARDRVVEFGLACNLTAATLARLAREVIDLSRSEIAEVSEPGGHHRGASSTMPQKANPIWSEAILGLTGTAAALASALLRVMEAGHERAAGEWQIEWQVLPDITVLCGSALLVGTQLIEELRVDAAAMQQNLTVDSGNLFAEGYMMKLAECLGREDAHDLVSAAARQARDTRRPLSETLRGMAPPELRPLIDEVVADGYLGQVDAVCKAAITTWEAQSAKARTARGA